MENNFWEIFRKKILSPRVSACLSRKITVFCLFLKNFLIFLRKNDTVLKNARKRLFAASNLDFQRFVGDCFGFVRFLSSFKKGQQITQKQQDTGNYPQYFGVPPAWCDKPNNKADNCNYGNHNVCYISFTHINPDLQT